jgi:peptidoglycan/LPS O-acetylase OafA/YrhL
VKRAIGLDRPAAGIASATPADRDRYLDFLRALAITVVVVGHWLAAVVWLRDGDLQVTTALDVEPATHWLTWIGQVMPLFFLVGGAVNARSWRTTRASGGGWAAWVARRSARLLRPTTILVWVWMLLGPLALIAGLGHDLVRLAGATALVPLWFLAVYLALIVLVPALLAAHERIGLALPAVLLILAAGIDAVEAVGIPQVGMLNYLVVWSVPTVLGFHWVDGTFSRRTLRIGLPMLALGALVAAVTWLGYPVSMIGLGDGNGPNTPAVTLALLGCAQAGVAVALKAPVTRWLQRPRAWAAVVRLNMVAMTIYLWHLTVMVVAISALQATGSWWSVAPLSGVWWLTRPLWVLGLAALLAPVVAVVAPIERSSSRAATRPKTAGMVVAAVVAAAAIAELALGGILGWPAVVAALALTAAAVHAGAFRSRVAVAR